MKTNKILQVIILVYLYFMYGRNELAVTPPHSWSCITPVEIYWFEETHTAWLLASAMSERPPSAGSETGWRTAGNAHSRSWRTDPPPLSRAGSKSSDPTQGATSTLLEESLFLKRVSGQPFRRLGMCAALMERKWRLRACTKLWIVHSRTRRPWWFMKETTDILSVRINTCRCSSCSHKSFSTKKTASSSKAVGYVPLGLRFWP